MSKYDHEAIEKKWQDLWEEKKTFKVDVDASKPKYYVLDMFPYPSGAGLHVGHLAGYTATDIVARYKRALGYNVLHPMGWDSFGLPAEQYAVRTGTHPALTTKANVDAFRRQLKSVGFSYNWDREISTSDSSYYKWTQWIFSLIYKKGLAYEAEVSVNYCPYLGTVLANEEVEGGKSKEGGHPVIKRPFRQWMLKITEYADRLIEDLDLVDWPQSIKSLQINWIGKSEGVTIDFPIYGRSEVLQVFTTRHDTLFGVTYLAIAPEHPLVDVLTTADHKEEVRLYQEKVLVKTDVERTELNKDKTGVFSGSFAVHPITGEKLPIWIADYVLQSYGTGAVMAVPAHCERDFDFARKHNLPMKSVVFHEPGASEQGASEQGASHKEKAWEGDGILNNSSYKDISLDGQNTEKAKDTMAIWLEKNGKGKKKIHYKLRDWLFSRQRYWGEPIPILHFEDGTKRILDLDELPLCPPDIQDFKPSPDGSSPLAKVSDWVKIIDPKTNKKASRETNTMPNWAGSCWYYLNFCDPNNPKAAFSEEAEKYWLPIDLYVGGVEHATLHLLYARFWHKVLYDLKLVTTLEPFKQLRNQGLILSRSYRSKSGLYVSKEDVVEKDGKYFHAKTGEELESIIEKMSKSKLNGVPPDEIIAQYGADAVRLYEMFMAPIDKDKTWNTDAVSGCYRFLTRCFDLVDSDKLTDEESEEALRLINRLIFKVTADMEILQFNTAIAKMMEFMNDFTRLEKYPKTAVSDFVKLLNPFAPHISEELWEKLGHKEELSFAAYPKGDPKFLVDAVVTYVVQVNGKLRARLDLPKDESEEVIVEIAKNHANVIRFLENQKIAKVVFVPNKLLNFVVE